MRCRCEPNRDTQEGHEFRGRTRSADVATGAGGRGGDAVIAGTGCVGTVRVSLGQTTLIAADPAVTGLVSVAAFKNESEAGGDAVSGMPVDQHLI
jgi:hypothetical protein